MAVDILPYRRRDGQKEGRGGLGLEEAEVISARETQDKNRGPHNLRNDSLVSPPAETKSYLRPSAAEGPFKTTNNAVPSLSIAGVLGARKSIDEPPST